jgi:hypothetical protein
MRMHVMVLLGLALLVSPALAQAPTVPDAEQAALAGAVQKAVVRALNFDQGDLARLRASRKDFTPEGWKQFMKHLDGWLDDKGAPTFTSSFVPSGGPTIISQSGGVLQLTMTGTLKQRQNNSTTTYPIVVEVTASGRPMKIADLKQSICGGRTATPCQ